MLPPPFTPVNNVKYYFDTASNRTLYRVVAPNGSMVAEGIDSERVARQVACLRQLVESNAHLLERVKIGFWRKNRKLPLPTPTREELAEDKSGKYAAKYPQLQALACLLIALDGLKDYIK